MCSRVRIVQDLERGDAELPRAARRSLQLRPQSARCEDIAFRRRKREAGNIARFDDRVARDEQGERAAAGVVLRVDVPPREALGTSSRLFDHLLPVLENVAFVLQTFSSTCQVREPAQVPRSARCC